MAAHPGDDKGVVTGFIESLPGDTIKYELDKDSGYLMIDRAQRTTACATLSLWVHPSHVLR
jgi:inorganic pyrophosphatase